MEALQACGVVSVVESIALVMYNGLVDISNKHESQQESKYVHQGVHSGRTG